MNTSKRSERESAANTPLEYAVAKFYGVSVANHPPLALAPYRPGVPQDRRSMQVSDVRPRSI